VYFPPWAIAAILAATVVLSVGTTLITLALQQIRWAGRQAANQNPPRQRTKPKSVTHGPRRGSA